MKNVSDKSYKRKSKCTFYVEIKCQLDAAEVFIADLIACSTCFGHHYAHHQELKSIIQWLLPVVFRAVVFKLLVWCGAEGYVFGLQDAALLEVVEALHYKFEGRGFDSRWCHWNFSLT